MKLFCIYLALFLSFLVFLAAAISKTLEYLFGAEGIFLFSYEIFGLDRSSQFYIALCSFGCFLLILHIFEPGRIKSLGISSPSNFNYMRRNFKKKIGTAFKNLFVMMLSTIFCLLLLEVTLRFVDDKKFNITENFVVSKTELVQVFTHTIYDRDLGWWHKSNVESLALHPPYNTNELGFRVHNDKVFSKGSILVVGDSFAEGSEVANNESWPALLEEMTGKQVLNGAIGGFGTDQIVLAAERYIELLEPRTIVVGFLSDDIMRAGLSYFSGGGKPYFLVEKGKLSLKNSPVPRMSEDKKSLGYLRQWLGYSYFVDWTMRRLDLSSFWYNKPFVRIDNDPTLVSCLLLERIKNYTDKKNVKLIFLMQYGGAELVERDTPNHNADHVVKCALSLGINTVDTWAPLKSILNEKGVEKFRDLYVMSDDWFGHMSKEGNQIISNLLAPVVNGLDNPI